MQSNIATELIQFIKTSPSAFHAVDTMKKEFLANGFTALAENERWNLKAGGQYFITRNDSSIIAFSIPENGFHGMRIMASHSDSPSFKIKENPEMEVEKHYIKLNVERYGGMIFAPWFDRPLSVAGRLIIKNPSTGTLESRLVNVDRDLVMIPNLAIHMNREVNSGYKYNAQKDMLPLYGMSTAKDTFMETVAGAAHVSTDDILGHDLFLYNRESASIWGAKNLYQVWKKMIVEMQEAVEDARRYMGGRSESLKIGVLDSHKSESYLWEYVEAFHDLYPDISLAVESERPEVLHKKLMENELDVIFTVRYDMETISWTGHHMELVKETPFTVCMRADNPLVDKQVWEVKDLKECNLVMISALHLPSYNSMIVELCLKYGFFPNIVYNAQNAASQIYNLLKENDVFICDKYHKDYGSSHVISRPIKNTKSGVVMVWKNERKKYLCQFIDVVRNCRQHEQQENIQNGRMPEEEK